MEVCGGGVVVCGGGVVGCGGGVVVCGGVWRGGVRWAMGDGREGDGQWAVGDGVVCRPVGPSANCTGSRVEGSEEKINDLTSRSEHFMMTEVSATGR